MWFSENDMKENKMGNKWHACINLSSIFYWNITLKITIPPIKKVGWEVYTITLLKLPQIWIICIVKGDPKNFVQVTTILHNLYGKHCLLIKSGNEIHKIEVFLGSNLNFTIRDFTWVLANNDNIYKKIFCPIQ